MPASHRIYADQRVALIRLWGVLTGAEIDEVRRAIRADADFTPSLRYLADMRAVTVLAYSSSHVRHVAATQIFRGGQRRAIVAAAPEQYGVARMFATCAALEGEVVEVFHEWGAAAEWLELAGELARDPGVPVEAA